MTQSLSRILDRRKWMLYAHGQHIVVVKGTRERFVHPLMKALIWALYLPDYPNSTIEVRIGDRYKPDVIAYNTTPTPFQEPEPVFWGEAGRTGKPKIASVARRYPRTHLAIAKWQTPLHTFVPMVEDAIAGLKRYAPIDVISFPQETQYCIDDDGNITISHDDVDYVRL